MFKVFLVLVGVTGVLLLELPTQAIVSIMQWHARTSPENRPFEFWRLYTRPRAWLMHSTSSGGTFTMKCVYIKVGLACNVVIMLMIFHRITSLRLLCTVVNRQLPDWHLNEKIAACELNYTRVDDEMAASVAPVTDSRVILITAPPNPLSRAVLVIKPPNYIAVVWMDSNGFNFNTCTVAL